MSLDYEYLFNQIDKAKKKKKKRWTRADTDAWYKKQEEDKAKEEKFSQSTGPTKDIDPRKRRFEQQSERATRVPGRKRGKQVESKTRMII